MNRNRRNYIKENGRRALRKMSNKRTTPQPIKLEDNASLVRVQKIGSLCKLWSPVYCTWVWEATIEINGLVLRFESCEETSEKAIRWAREKYCAIKNPRFARLLQGHISRSDYSLGDIAEHIGITANGISKWIAGDTHPTVPMLLRLCKMLFKDTWEKEYLTLSKIVEMERI
jgi:hypothetical protein